MPDGLFQILRGPQQTHVRVVQFLGPSPAFGQIDVLINNAGINIRGTIEELSVEEFQRVQETNVTGMWLLCREVAP